LKVRGKFVWLVGLGIRLGGKQLFCIAQCAAFVGKTRYIKFLSQWHIYGPMTVRNPSVAYDFEHAVDA
jgi:hypothetical protein